MAEADREDKAPLPTKPAETPEEARIEAALPVDAELPFQRKYWPEPFTDEDRVAITRMEAEARAWADKAHTSAEIRARLYRATDTSPEALAKAVQRELAKEPVKVEIVGPLPLPTEPQAETGAPVKELPRLTPTARRMIQSPFWPDGRPLDLTIEDMMTQLGVSRDAVTDAIRILNLRSPEKWPLKR
jgi:hypothetical protein